MSSDRRLHPLSLLFRLKTQIRQFLFPIAIAFIASRARSDNPPWLLILVGLSLVSALVDYIFFRYRYGETELIVRSGVFVKNERHIPYDRIQNIDATQSLLHRMFGVVTVTVQTGSGKQAEAELAVLPLSGLEEMRARVLAGAQAARGNAPAPVVVARGEPEPVDGEGIEAIVGRELTRPAVDPRVEPFLRVGPRDLLIAGLIENRAFVLLLGGLAFLSQIDELYVPLAEAIEDHIPWIVSLYETAERSFTAGTVPVAGVALAAGSVLAMLMLLRLMAAVWTVVRLYDFRVSRQGEDIRVEHGLLTRVTKTIPLRRIQWLLIEDTPVHRLMGRVAIRMTTAGGATENGRRSAEREWLAPMLARERVQQIVDLVQPGVKLGTEWRHPHPRGFRRALVVGSVVPLIVSAGLAPFIGWWSLAVFVVLEANTTVGATLLMRNLAWSATENAVLFRGGRWRRRITVTRYSRIQVVSHEESPFDRRTAMATVRADTAGSSGSHLGVRYLPRGDAEELRELLAAETGKTAFVW